MKNILKTIGVFVVAAICLNACNKEVSIDDFEQEEFIYSFRISNLDNGANTETKSVFTDNGTSVYTTWENGDQFGAYAISGDKASNNRPSLVTVDDNGFTLNVATTTALDANSTVYTYYPYSVGAGANSSNAVINFASIQTQNSDGYDAVAMPMAGIPFIIDHALEQNSNTTVGEINFLNLGAIIKFNIFSSTTNTELIKSVSFKANKNLVGNYTLNLQNVSTSDESTLAVSGDGEYDEVKTVLSTPVTVGSSKENGVAVYMVVAPGAYKGDVVVTTDAHTYTFAVTTEKTFNRSKVKPLNADLKNATQGALGQEDSWELCDAVSDFTEGTYVIIDASKTYFLSNAIANAKAAPAGGTVTFVDGQLSSVSPEMKWNATAVDGGIQFESAAHAGYYLWGGNTNNGIRVANVEPTSSEMGMTAPVSKVWTFVANADYGGDGGYLATTGSDRYLTLYATNHDWRNYKIGTYGLGMSQEGQATNYAAMFYKLVDSRTALDAPILQIDGTTVSWAEVENAESYEVTIAEETTTTTNLAFDVDKLGLDDGYYTIAVRAIPEDETLYKPSAVATGEVKIGTPKLSAPTLSKGTITKNAITVNWDAVDEADGYSAMIVNKEDEEDFDLVDVTATTVTFTGLTPSTEYTVYVSATDSRNRFATSDQASLDVTTAEDVALVKGSAWFYTFTNNPFSNNSATLTSNNVALAWTTSVAPSFTNEALSFGTNSAPLAASMSTDSYTDGVSNIIIGIKGNSKQSVTAAVSVGGVSLKCNGETSVTQTGNTLTNYEFVAEDLVAGTITIAFTAPTGGYQIKTIAINPVPATQLVMSDIECTAHTSSSVTFEWDAVTGAVDYEVSTDGTNYASTNNTLTYTWGGRQPSTGYQIWVKAIGDGIQYVTSEPKQSAVGTTDESSGEIPDPDTYTMVSTNVGTYTGAGGTLTFSKGENNSNGPTWNSGDNAVRLYQKNTITVSASNSNIASIVMSVKVRQSSGKNPSVAILSGGGSIDPETCSTSTTTITWTAGETETDEVVLVLTSVAGNINFSSIEVTYK